MTTTDSLVTPSFRQMTQKQLEVYAVELYQHFYEERRLRSELEERNRQLEQRIQELSALNKLFQEFLGEYFAFTESYEHIATALEAMAREAAALSPRIRSQPLADTLRQGKAPHNGASIS